MRCPKCGTENGMTMYVGKTCKRCGEVLVINTDIPTNKNKEDGTTK